MVIFTHPESQYREVRGGMAHVGGQVHSRTGAAMSPGRTASVEEARLVNAQEDLLGQEWGWGQHIQTSYRYWGTQIMAKGPLAHFLIHDLSRSLLNKHFSQPPH